MKQKFFLDLCRNMNPYTFTEENYLKAIYALSHTTGKGVSTNDIAGTLETKPATVTDMLRKLGEKGLILYKKYQGARLTDQGQRVAIGIIRKHRLWECFLVEKLHFGWDEVHEIAEQLEHIHSTKLTNSLEEFLGFPKYDPHGDPIPDRNGVFPESSDRTLAEFEPGDTVKVIAVKDSSPEFLRYLEKNNISLGDLFEIVDAEEFDGSLKVLHKGHKISLSLPVIQNIYVL